MSGLEQGSSNTPSLETSPEHDRAQEILYTLLQDPHQEANKDLWLEFEDINAKLNKSASYFVDNPRLKLDKLKEKIYSD